MRTIVVLCTEELEDEAEEAITDVGDDPYVYTSLADAVSRTLLLTPTMIFIQRVFLENGDLSPLTCLGTNQLFEGIIDLERKLT